MKPRSLLPLVVLMLATACLREPEPPPPPTPKPAHAVVEENLQPDPTVRIEIIDLKDTQDPATKRVTVVGTLINRGTKPTSQVQVKLTALDENGDTVLSIFAVPSTDHIPADGGMARFTAEFDATPAIRRYHVDALAR